MRLITCKQGLVMPGQTLHLMSAACPVFSLNSFSDFPCVHVCVRRSSWTSDHRGHVPATGETGVHIVWVHMSVHNQ